MVSIKQKQPLLPRLPPPARRNRGSPGSGGRSRQTSGGGGLPARQPEEGRPGLVGAAATSIFHLGAGGRRFWPSEGTVFFVLGLVFFFFFARPGNGLSSMGAPGLTEEE